MASVNDGHRCSAAEFAYIKQVESLVRAHDSAAAQALIAEVSKAHARPSKNADQFGSCDSFATGHQFRYNRGQLIEAYKANGHYFYNKGLLVKVIGQEYNNYPVRNFYRNAEGDVTSVVDSSGHSWNRQGNSDNWKDSKGQTFSNFSLHDTEASISFKYPGGVEQIFPFVGAPLKRQPHRDASNFADIFVRDFKLLDRQHKNSLAENDLASAMQNSAFVGEDAQMVAALYGLRRQIMGFHKREELKDVIPGKDRYLYFPLHAAAITLADVQAFAGEIKKNTDFARSMRKQIDDYMQRTAGSALAASSAPLFGPRNTPEPDEVNQGDLGDCYFLGPLMSLAASSPDYIKHMITQNSDNTFTVTFPKAPLELPITVSRPTAAELGVFNASIESVWAGVLEKAYGEYIGRHKPHTAPEPIENLEGGGYYPDEILELLTGKKFSHVTVSSLSDAKIRQIFESVNQGHPATTATDTPWFAFGDESLVDNHAYSIIKYDPASKTLLMRNPWGRGGEDAFARSHIGRVGCESGCDQFGDLKGAGYFYITVDEFKKRFQEIDCERQLI